MYSTVQTVHCTEHTVQHILYMLYCTVHTVQHILHITWCSSYKLYFSYSHTTHTIHCTANCTLLSTYCTLFSTYWTAHGVITHLHQITLLTYVIHPSPGAYTLPSRSNTSPTIPWCSHTLTRCSNASPTIPWCWHTLTTSWCSHALTRCSHTVRTSTTVGAHTSYTVLCTYSICSHLLVIKLPNLFLRVSCIL